MGCWGPGMGPMLTAYKANTLQPISGLSPTPLSSHAPPVTDLATPSSSGPLPLLGCSHSCGQNPPAKAQSPIIIATEAVLETSKCLLCFRVKYEAPQATDGLAGALDARQQSNSGAVSLPHPPCLLGSPWSAPSPPLQVMELEASTAWKGLDCKDVWRTTGLIPGCSGHQIKDVWAEGAS